MKCHRTENCWKNSDSLVYNSYLIYPLNIYCSFTHTHTQILNHLLPEDGVKCQKHVLKKNT